MPKVAAPEVTVLMPVYNGERYLRPAVESVLAQSFDRFELLVVDDGSTDASARIIGSYNDPRIRMIRNERRQKLSGALNRGLDHARGKYVARMDADDLCLPNRLEIQTAFMERNPGLGMCGSWAKMFGARRTTVYRAPAGYDRVRAKALFDNPFVHPSVMIRKPFFDQHDLRFDGWYNPTEDFELWSRAIRLFPCDNIQQVLIHYRVHDQGMTGSDWNRMDAKALPIVNRELAELGLNLSEAELRFHRKVGREASYPCGSSSEVERAEKWLKLILDVNRERKRYAESALKDIVGDNWFRLCLNASHLGFGLLQRFLRSPLTDRGIGNIRKIGLLALAVIYSTVYRTRIKRNLA